MKAITAIDSIIILVLGILALVAILGLFMGVWNPAKSGTSLQTATQTTCQKVNPTFCKTNTDPAIPHANMYAARMPVYDFDVNGNQTTNDHHPDGVWRTMGGDDNLEMLCYNFYGCRIQLTGEFEWSQWSQCCLEKVCGCQRY